MSELLGGATYTVFCCLSDYACKIIQAEEAPLQRQQQLNSTSKLMTDYKAIMVFLLQQKFCFSFAFFTFFTGQQKLD